MVTVYRTDEWLEHHGIQGQKWGVRNGPPYPLGYSDHSASEKKQNTKTFLSKYDNQAAGGGPSSPSSSKKKSASTKSSNGLTDEQKAKIKKYLMAGAIAAGTALAAYGAYKVYSNYWAGLDAEIDPETGFLLIKGEHSPADDIKALNPGAIMTPYGMLDAVTGSTSNCMLCTTNYELRRRGYDVHAGLSTDGYTDDLFDSIFEGANVVKPNCDSVGELQRFIESSYPEGARGNFMYYYGGLFSGAGGHSIVWEIENGKLVMRDGQAKIVSQSLEKALRYADISRCELVRTDNLKIKADELKNMGYTRSTNNTKFIVDNMASIPVNLVMNNADELQAMGATAAVIGYAGYRVKESIDGRGRAKANESSKRS